MALSRTLKLYTGARMPVLGLGTFQSGGKLAEALDYSIHLGYRHIDAAWSYETQPVIGETLKSLEKERKIKREDLFITTKIPGNFLTEKGVRHVVEESLEQLQTSYVDMLLIHSPFGKVDKPGLEDIQDTSADFVQGWKLMEKVASDGQAKAIGVSNMSTRQMDKIEERCKIKIANAQSESHCYFQQRELRRYCIQMGIVFTAYSPLGAPTRPPRHINDGDPPPLLKNEVVMEIAKKLNKSPAQILLRYMMDLGVAVIPKSTTLDRIKENSEICDFTIDKDDKDLLKSLNTDQRYFQFLNYKDHKNFPKNERF